MVLSSKNLVICCKEQELHTFDKFVTTYVAYTNVSAIEQVISIGVNFPKFHWLNTQEVYSLLCKV